MRCTRGKSRIPSAYQEWTMWSLYFALPLQSTMEKASHLSVIVDLSPAQWQLSAQATNPHPLSIETFLSHLLAFLNAHIAAKHENTLAVFGTLPGKRSVGRLSQSAVSSANIPKRHALFFDGNRDTSR